MGYTTTFNGRFNVDKPLTEAHAAYLRAFNETRRMKRNAAVAETLPDPRRLAVGLPIGSDGAYFVGAEGFMGQHEDISVLDGNLPPGQSRKGYEREKSADAQPGLWCQWRPTDDNTGIEWDQGGKFYDYAEWLQYLVKHFLSPWGYVLNGEVTWQGKEHGDTGTLRCVANEVTAAAN